MDAMAKTKTKERQSRSSARTSKVVSFSAAPELMGQVEAVAKAEGITKSKAIDTLIRSGLNQRSNSNSNARISQRLEDAIRNVEVFPFDDGCRLVPTWHEQNLLAAALSSQPECTRILVAITPAVFFHEVHQSAWSWLTNSKTTLGKKQTAAIAKKISADFPAIEHEHRAEAGLSPLSTMDYFLELERCGNRGVRGLERSAHALIDASFTRDRMLIKGRAGVKVEPLSMTKALVEYYEWSCAVSSLPRTGNLEDIGDVKQEMAKRFVEAYQLYREAIGHSSVVNHGLHAKDHDR